MSLEFYKIFHFIGIIMLFLAIGGAIIRASLGVKNEKLIKFIMINHGIAGLIILVTGFGQLARLGVGFPGWVILKIAIWLSLLIIVIPIKKAADKKNVFWFVALSLGAVAAYVGLYKPF